MKKLVVPILMLAFTVFSCVENTPEQDLSMSDTLLVRTKKVNSDAVLEILRSIPSPIETTNSIERSGASCDLTLLNAVDHLDHYQSSFQKGINLGVYGTDLGYLNLYSKTVASFEYLDNIRRLSDDLKIGQFFDFATIKRLASNKNNIDSIINISTSGFEEMNGYLTSQKRENVSTLILVGGWVESVYLLSKIAETTQNQDLIEKIGEQKFALSQIVLLLEMYKDNESYDVLYNRINDLKQTFDKVKITYIYSEPEMKEVNGMLVVIDNSRNVIEMSPEVFKEIVSKVSETRQALVK